MTDENKPEDTNDSGTATAEEHTHAHAPDHDHDHEHEPERLKQTVQISDVGPWKKHIKISIDGEMIQARLDEKYREMAKETDIPGFRKGKTPIKIMKKRYHKEVGEQVRNELLMVSLEQLAEEEKIAPLSMPEIDPDKLDIPEEGDFVYEFEVEVRPEFDLPEYKGLKLKRPVYEFTDEDVQAEQDRILRRNGQLVPKEDGKVEMGDVVIANMTVKDGDKELATAEEVNFVVEKELVLQDSVAKKFSEEIVGASTGETRKITLTLGEQVADPALRGKEVDMSLEIVDLKTVRLPELTDEYLMENLGVANEQQFKELLKFLLERRLEHEQRQSLREQIMEHFADTTDWELPKDMLARQAQRAMARRIMEMRSDGISEEEIQTRRRKLESDIIQNTALALKEHFVLQKIAEEEKIEVNDDDIDVEIERIAAQSDESPRRVRARLEKEDSLEALAAEMIERRALDLILDAAEYEDVPLDEDLTESVSAVEEQGVTGEMRDLEAEGAVKEEAEDEPSSEPRP